MTVAELIRGAFRTLGVLAAEETPSAAEESDALTTLNDMLDSWAGERLILFATLRSMHTLTQGLNPHTIGTGGTFNVTRPVRIDRASIVFGANPSSEMPLDILSDSDWQMVQAKMTSGAPGSLWVESSYPLMKLWMNPIPNAADTLVLYTWQQIGRFAATSTTLDVPPGYTRAIRYNLAKELAPEYGTSLQPEALDIANESKSTLKRLNYMPSYLRSDPAILGRGGASAILGGGGGGGSDSGGLY